MRSGAAGAPASVSRNWPSCGGSSRRSAARRTLAGALRVEQSVGDTRAGAGERQEGHGDLRVLDRERKRGARLIAVERAVAGADSQRAPWRAIRGVAAVPAGLSSQALSPP